MKDSIKTHVAITVVRRASEGHKVRHSMGLRDVVVSLARALNFTHILNRVATA